MHNCWASGDDNACETEIVLGHRPCQPNTFQSSKGLQHVCVEQCTCQYKAASMVSTRGANEKVAGTSRHKQACVDNQLVTILHTWSLQHTFQILEDFGVLRTTVGRRRTCVEWIDDIANIAIVKCYVQLQFHRCTPYKTHTIYCLSVCLASLSISCLYLFAMQQMNQDARRHTDRSLPQCRCTQR